MLIEANEWGDHLAAMASEEMDSIQVVPNRRPQGEYLLQFDPLAFIVEQAGGSATNGRERILDIVPSKLHKRVSVVLGSKNEVSRVTGYHLSADKCQVAIGSGLTG